MTQGVLLIVMILRTTIVAFVMRFGFKSSPDGRCNGRLCWMTHPHFAQAIWDWGIFEEGSNLLKGGTFRRIGGDTELCHFLWSRSFWVVETWLAVVGDDVWVSFVRSLRRDSSSICHSSKAMSAEHKIGLTCWRLDQRPGNGWITAVESKEWEDILNKRPWECI